MANPINKDLLGERVFRFAYPVYDENKWYAPEIRNFRNKDLPGLWNSKSRILSIPVNNRDIIEISQKVKYSSERKFNYFEIVFYSNNMLYSRLKDENEANNRYWKNRYQKKNEDDKDFFTRSYIKDINVFKKAVIKEITPSKSIMGEMEILYGEDLASCVQETIAVVAEMIALGEPLPEKLYTIAKKMQSIKKGKKVKKPIRLIEL